MDLTRLYNLTTPELREEAERLGVADTYAMSRGQLIHAIRNKSGGNQPEGLLGKVFGFAKWALQAAGETSARDVGTTSRETTHVDPATISEASAEAEVAPPVPVPVAAPARVVEPVRASSEESSSSSDGEDTGPPSRPPVGVFSNSASLFEEPFPTRTMARILAEQGHYKRSLAIYARLLQEAPADGELTAEADAVRAEARARRSHAPH